MLQFNNVIFYFQVRHKSGFLSTYTANNEVFGKFNILSKMTLHKINMSHDTQTSTENFFLTLISFP